MRTRENSCVPRLAVTDLTPLCDPGDPFGRTRVRKTERSLIAEYRDLMESALATLDPSSHEAAVALACLPDGIRGYEDIKLRSVEEFRRRAAELRGQLAASEQSVPA